MNRDRFRFRVWSEKVKGYYFDMRLTVDGDLVPSKWLEPNSIPDLGRIVIEQCTGLADKNGKLIYEGDVVKTKDFGKDIDNRINVNGYDTFVVKFHECGFYIENNSRRFPMSCRPKLEIIGNIHQVELKG